MDAIVTPPATAAAVAAHTPPGPGLAPRPRLPAPDADARRHSARLVSQLRAQIRAAGWLGFDAFMHAALYAPGLGYYQAGLPKFGGVDAGGDFVTAAGLGDVTARCLARQCAEVLAGLGDGGGDGGGDDGGGGDGGGDGGGRDILEVGGGDGRMAADILRALARCGALPGRYFLLETSAELRARQQRRLAGLPAEARARVRWLEALPEEFSGVILAVEVLDAMPAQRFEIDADGRALALGVALDESGDGGDRGDGNSHSNCDTGAAAGDGHSNCDTGDGDGDGDSAGAPTFRWATAAPLPAALQRRITEALGGELPPGYRGEINLRAEAWMRAAGACLRRGALIVVDYGFPRREFYHPQRRDGTLMCHYRHRAHADPFFHPGLQDISAHVDFTAIADAARAAGLTVAGFASQGAFLLSLGALDLVAGDGAGAGDGDGDGDGDGADVFRSPTRELARLTLPHEMGELFKVAAFTRATAGPLSGFALKNRRAAL